MAMLRLQRLECSVSRPLQCPQNLLENQMQVGIRLCRTRSFRWMPYRSRRRLRQAPRIDRRPLQYRSQMEDGSGQLNARLRRLLDQRHTLAGSDGSAPLNEWPRLPAPPGTLQQAWQSCVATPAQQGALATMPGCTTSNYCSACVCSTISSSSIVIYKIIMKV